MSNVEGERVVNAGKKVAVLDRLKNAAGPFLPILSYRLYVSHDSFEEEQSNEQANLIESFGAYGAELDEKLDSIIQTTHQKQL